MIGLQFCDFYLCILFISVAMTDIAAGVTQEPDVFGNFGELSLKV